ncbi:MAG: hypothetical protein ACKO5Q_26170 [Microcystaceae cyanobacterium]
MPVERSPLQKRDPLYGKMTLGYFSDPLSFPPHLGDGAIAAEKHDF